MTAIVSHWGRIFHPLSKPSAHLWGKELTQTLPTFSSSHLSVWNLSSCPIANSYFPHVKQMVPGAASIWHSHGGFFLGHPPKPPQVFSPRLQKSTFLPAILSLLPALSPLPRSPNDPDLMKREAKTSSPAQGLADGAGWHLVAPQHTARAPIHSALMKFPIHWKSWNAAQHPFCLNSMKSVPSAPHQRSAFADASAW